jgi:DNA-binding NarL/FixJ family response regulator
MATRVALIEDRRETREMLYSLISEHEGYLCIGAFESAEEAIRELPGLKVDVVLVDIHLPGKSGIDGMKKLKPLMPQTQFIMCTLLEDSDTIFIALKAGASGYLSKSTSPAKILEAIADAHQGGSPMSSQIARKVVAFFQTEEEKKAELAKLSAREQEILNYLSKGYRYKEIAGILFISIETVRKHIHNIYEKLQVNSRTDALNKVK